MLSPGLLSELSELNLSNSSRRAFIRHREIRKMATPTIERNTREPSTPATILMVFEDVTGEGFGIIVELGDAGDAVEEVITWEDWLLVPLEYEARGETKKPARVYDACALVILINSRCSSCDDNWGETYSGWLGTGAIARGNVVVEGDNLSMMYAAVGGSSWLLAGTVPKTTIELPAMFYISAPRTRREDW